VTEDANNYFQDRQNRSPLMIADAAFIDIMMVVQSYYFSRYGTTWRLIFAGVFFYLTRSIT